MNCGGTSKILTHSQGLIYFMPAASIVKQGRDNVSRLCLRGVAWHWRTMHSTVKDMYAIIWTVESREKHLTARRIPIRQKRSLVRLEVVFLFFPQGFRPPENFCGVFQGHNLLQISLYHTFLRCARPSQKCRKSPERETLLTMRIKPNDNVTGNKNSSGKGEASS